LLRYDISGDLNILALAPADTPAYESPGIAPARVVSEKVDAAKPADLGLEQK